MATCEAYGTDAENGATSTFAYNAADQVTNSGWTYDNAGNLTSDGTTAYTYNALSQVITQTVGVQTTRNTYNADGTLVTQVVGSTTTRYTQDLASPLSQVLGDGTNRYVYGLERLYSQQGTGARTWYVHDALGSLRQTLSAAGVPQSNISYDPWGAPLNSLSVPFGFTGELQQGNQVYLRARWYNAQRGVFSSRDPFIGMPEQPYSQHYYQYAYSAPTTWTDPSGNCVIAFGVDTVACVTVAWYLAGAAVAAGASVYCAQTHCGDRIASSLSDTARRNASSATRTQTKTRTKTRYVDGTDYVPAPAPTPVREIPGPIDTRNRDCPTPTSSPTTKPVTPTPLSSTPTPTPDQEEWVGYHGTSSVHAPSIISSINPSTGMNTGGKAQLGTGFYTTRDIQAALLFANNAVLISGGEPVILNVYSKKKLSSLIGAEVKPGLWGRVTSDYITRFDFLYSPISGYESAIQVKFNPRAYRYLVARIR